MASPAPKPPAGNTPDSADILAAIRDLGDRMERRFEKVETSIKEQGRDISKLQQDVARVDGRVSQLPTLWQIAGLIFAIFGAAFVLIRFAPPH